jgi:hypothetical protein
VLDGVGETVGVPDGVAETAGGLEGAGEAVGDALALAVGEAVPVDVAVAARVMAAGAVGVRVDAALEPPSPQLANARPAMATRTPRAGRGSIMLWRSPTLARRHHE